MYKSVAGDSGGGGGGEISTQSINISANGTYRAPTGKAYTPVNVNVQNSYGASDEGKVVSNGSLVSQTEHAEVTQNGTIDTTLNNSVTVNVPQGSTPTGTKQISISQNGTTTEDVSAYASAEITVNVPTSGGGSDLSAVDVFVGDYLSTTDLIITTGAVNRYQRYLVGG